MSGFGATNPWPRRFGGGTRAVESVHVAMLDALAPGWDVTPGSDVYAEAHAHAAAVSIIWACNERLRSQAIPMRMLEALPEWEGATGLRPGRDDSMIARRRKLAAKLRGIAGNTIADILAVCQAIFGSNFVDIHTATSSSTVVYWLGGPLAYAPDGTPLLSAPGPPGFEWCSNRLAIGVEVSQGSDSTATFGDKMSALSDALDALLPAPMTFQIGTGHGGFICDVGILDLTLL